LIFKILLKCPWEGVEKSVCTVFEIAVSGDIV